MKRFSLPVYSRRLLLALLVSLSLHLLALFEPWIQLPTITPHVKPLEVTFLIQPAGVVKMASPTYPNPPLHKRARRRLTIPRHHRESPKPILTTPVSKSALTSSPAPMPVRKTSSPVSTVRPMLAAAKIWPQRIELDYLLYKGAQGLIVGRVVHTLEIKHDHYSITGVAEATGLFSLFRSGKLVQISQGTITAAGLRPDSFWVERGQSANTTDSAQFNWETHTLTIQSPDGNRVLPLSAGTQDLLSFQYQFAVKPPPVGTSVALAITNGRKLNHVIYTAVGRTTLTLPDGSKMPTLHLVKQDKPHGDRTDLWLAVDKGYLPVKVKLTRKDGDSAQWVLQHVKILKEK